MIKLKLSDAKQITVECRKRWRDGDNEANIISDLAERYRVKKTVIRQIMIGVPWNKISEIDIYSNQLSLFEV